MNKLKIENNHVICECGKDFGEWKEGQVYFCKKCLIATGFINTYFSIKPENIFGKEILKGSE